MFVQVPASTRAMGKANLRIIGICALIVFMGISVIVGLFIKTRFDVKETNNELAEAGVRFI